MAEAFYPYDSEGRKEAFMWWDSHYHWRWLAERRCKQLNKGTEDEGYEFRVTDYGSYLRVEAFWLNPWRATPDAEEGNGD